MLIAPMRLPPPALRSAPDSSHQPDCTAPTPPLVTQTKDIPYSTIATGHGPLLRHNMRELVDAYATWSEATGKAPASVAVLYSDNYGFCDRLSQTVAKGITKAGIATEMVDLVREGLEREGLNWTG